MKNVCLIKENLGIRLTWNKNIIRIILLKLPPQMIIRLFVIIAMEMVTWVIDVMLKEMHTMESNVFGFQNKPLLTFKNPKSFVYLKLRSFFCMNQRKGKICGIWTVDVQHTWQGITLGFQVLPRSRNGGNISFGDNSKGKIIGIGNVGNVSSTLIENVYLVENLKHNLLSISQLCDKGYKVIFL